MRSEIEQVAKELNLVLLDGEEIKPGDLYLAHRNGPVKFLTCREVKNNYIVPIELDYCYDTWECVKVKEKLD